jgi:hypothetical protein
MYSSCKSHGEKKSNKTDIEERIFLFCLGKSFSGCCVFVHAILTMNLSLTATLFLLPFLYFPFFSYAISIKKSIKKASAFFNSLALLKAGPHNSDLILRYHATIVEPKISKTPLLKNGGFMPWNERAIALTRKERKRLARKRRRLQRSVLTKISK